MKVIAVILITILTEIILWFIFLVVAKICYNRTEIDFGSLIKGLIERVFITLFLFNNVPHALTVFSALKIATRMKHEDQLFDIQRFNNYYLLGNFISVSVSLFYVFIWNNAFIIERGATRFLAMP